ncbi:hypothetical protein GN244_ATG16528 [Phytophthora infestans]|uniref:Uncharacterized protein n=1 Tax=Phytophthora infestans TaxID=4787 RepID=A0A833T0H7_PHYIN|nr:hypothetical protein GN244_ATG16528 [Phytophthora infestans]
MHSLSDKLLCPVQALRHIPVACNDTESRGGGFQLRYALATFRWRLCSVEQQSWQPGDKELGTVLSRCYEAYSSQSAAATTGLTKRMV